MTSAATPTYHDLIQQLGQHPDAGVSVRLPDGETVPAHFHVTEVGRVQKDFIDCGGTVRSTAHCQLQLLVASDVDHRLKAEKLGRILEMSGPLFEKDDELPLVVEHEDGRTVAFPVIGIEAVDHHVELQLELPHPACLAADQCGLSEEDSGTQRLVFEPAPATGACLPGSGCC